MVWVFFLNLLITGMGPISVEVGPFASQLQCSAAQQAFTLLTVRTPEGFTYNGFTKSICQSRS